ncbi:MAG: phosphoribosylanthranilate isomerase [Halanaeroarchaeum sp.]
MTRVKVCGLTREADVAAVVEAGADALGAVVDVPVDSPREVAPERARELFEAVPPFVSTVLVTMPADVEHAVDLVERVGPDVVQVHAGLDPDRLANLASRIDATLVVGVDASDPERATALASTADALLVDSTDEAGAGGTGRTHDWERSRDLRASIDAPLILAGGLTPDSVGAAIETVAPYGVDVASGVESRGGQKDHEAVRDFVTAARGVQS